MTTTKTSSPRHFLISTLVYLILTIVSVILIVTNHQTEPCPIGEYRSYEQIAIKPLLFGFGMIGLGVFSMLTLFHLFELPSSLRASQKN